MMILLFWENARLAGEAGNDEKILMYSFHLYNSPSYNRILNVFIFK